MKSQLKYAVNPLNKEAASLSTSTFLARKPGDVGSLFSFHTNNVQAPIKVTPGDISTCQVTSPGVKAELAFLTSQLKSQHATIELSQHLTVLMHTTQEICMPVLPSPEITDCLFRLPGCYSSW